MDKDLIVGLFGKVKDLMRVISEDDKQPEIEVADNDLYWKEEPVISVDGYGDYYEDAYPPNDDWEKVSALKKVVENTPENMKVAKDVSNTESENAEQNIDEPEQMPVVDTTPETTTTTPSSQAKQNRKPLEWNPIPVNRGTPTMIWRRGQPVFQRLQNKVNSSIMDDDLHDVMETQQPKTISIEVAVLDNILELNQMLMDYVLAGGIMNSEQRTNFASELHKSVIQFGLRQMGKTNL